MPASSCLRARPRSISRRSPSWALKVARATAASAPIHPHPGGAKLRRGRRLGCSAGHRRFLQAIEAIKLILGIGESLVGRLLLIDTLDMSFRTLKVQRNPDCPLCGDDPTVTELIDYEQFCGFPGGGTMNTRRIWH